jgi:hypothetical protein
VTATSVLSMLNPSLGLAPLKKLDKRFVRATTPEEDPRAVSAQVELLQRQMEWEVERRQRLSAAAEALARERLRQAEDDAAKRSMQHWPDELPQPSQQQNAVALKVRSPGHPSERARAKHFYPR